MGYLHIYKCIAEYINIAKNPTQQTFQCKLKNYIKKFKIPQLILGNNKK